MLSAVKRSMVYGSGINVKAAIIVEMGVVAFALPPPREKKHGIDRKERPNDRMMV